MKKVYRKKKFEGSYVINVGKNDEVDEAKFEANISEGDSDKCEVIVLFGSEYDNLINEMDSMKKQVEDLKSSNIDKDSQIKDLNAKLDETNRFYIDKVTQSSKDLNKEFSDKIASVTSEKQSEIDSLKDKASEDNVQHLKEISDLKQTHSEVIHELDNNYKNTLVRLRTEDNNDISDYNKKIGRIKKDFEDLGFFEKHSNTYKNLLSEFDEAIDEFEKINKNKLLTIDEDFAKLPTKEVDEANEGNE